MSPRPVETLREAPPRQTPKAPRPRSLYYTSETTLPPWPSPAVAAPIRRALLLWLAVAVAVAVRTVVVPDQHTIYPVLAGASAHWWGDQPLYADYAPLDFFRYPPPFAVIFTPLAALGPRVGGILWSWLGIGVFVGGLWRFLRDVIPPPWTPTRQGIFLALGALGALRGLWNAQSNALAVGLLLLAASALVRRRWRTTAAILAGAVLVKLTPLAPALLLCALRPRRLAGRLALFLAAGLMVPFLTRSPGVVIGHYGEWLTHLIHSGSERWPGFRDAWTVWLVLREMAHGRFGVPPLRAPLDSLVYRGAQLLAAAAALAWCLWQRRHVADRRRRITLTLAMGMAWLMLFGPAVEHAGYVFLTPVLCWAVLERGGRWLSMAAFVLVMLLGWDAVGRAIPVLLTALPLGTTLFIGWLIGYGSRIHHKDTKDTKKTRRETKGRVQRRHASEPGFLLPSCFLCVLCVFVVNLQTNSTPGSPSRTSPMIQVLTRASSSCRRMLSA